MRLSCMMWIKALLAMIFASTSLLAQAGQCQAVSGPQRVPLLELYTSEGCSSCPPADRWLSGVAAQGFGPDRVVPLALHVDYWDYIGWPDRFARPAFGARQREQVQAAGSRVVYTPQVMLNGRDFSGWRGNGLVRALADINRQRPGADIVLSVVPGPEGFDLSASATSLVSARAALYVAVYQHDLESAVRAGENRGARLHHDYVVREWYGPIPVGAPWRQHVALKADWVASRLGVVAFVQDRGGEVLQALQLPYCPG